MFLKGNVPTSGSNEMRYKGLWFSLLTQQYALKGESSFLKGFLSAYRIFFTC